MAKRTFSLPVFAALLSTSPAQAVAPSPTRVELDSTIANTFLIHKAEPACHKEPYGVRVTGTVVIKITIGKSGNVKYTHTL